ncbi:rod shape-determining protein MreC [Bacillus carboniphilus]|uniref:Cell shape-determining protein MreC n=1 Tax=Bacillus carboniphilus TaxID=86663 RepID=A0ABY9K2G1_9BACI|nr:rod shape-determining protein MreC [Bacillus carboniphilus]WLR44086.1 rod shape-determining protein MreC [Bacillus carboniphilus]
MPQFFLNKKLIVLLVSIIVLVALIGFTLKEDREMTWPEKFLKDTVGLVQNVFHKPAQEVAGFFENVSHLKNTYTENEKLREKLEGYMAMEAQLERLEDDVQKLREKLNYEDQNLTSFEKISAVVYGRQKDQWLNYIYINKGSKDNVEKGDAVITTRGLIGKVKSVQEFEATVQLLSTESGNLNVSAHVLNEKNGEVFGIISGYDKEKEMLILENFDEKITEGDKVFSSGLGEVFTEGLAIGEVSEIDSDSYGLGDIAYVKPFAQFQNIDDVFVIKTDVGKPLDKEGQGNTEDTD